MAVKRLTSANLSSIGEHGQRSLAACRIGVAGLGGVGGIAFELLVRAGVGSMNISDSGFFEQSNANRQSLWSFCNDGREKAVVALEAATQANPACKISSFPAITRSNSAAFARGCSAVIDATDSPSSRTAVFSGCRRAAVPYIFASARGSRGMLSVFCGQDFEKEFALRHARQRQRPACDHALGPVANAMGCLAAQQAINLVLAKPAILFPKIISFDAFSKMPFAVHNF